MGIAGRHSRSKVRRSARAKCRLGTTPSSRGGPAMTTTKSPHGPPRALAAGTAAPGSLVLAVLSLLLVLAAPAAFADFTVTVVRFGSSTGTGTSDVGGIDCGSTCSGSYAPGTIVTLGAAAASPG